MKYKNLELIRATNIISTKNAEIVRVTNNVKKLKSLSIKTITNINYVNNVTISSALFIKIYIDFKTITYLIFNRDFI